MACDRGRVFLGSHPGLSTVAGVRAHPASVNSGLGAEPGIRQAAGSGSRSRSQERKHAFEGEGVSPEGRLAPGRRGLQAFSGRVSLLWGRRGPSCHREICAVPPAASGPCDAPPAAPQHMHDWRFLLGGSWRLRLEASASGLLESVAGSRSHDHGGHLSSDHRGSVPVDVARARVGRGLRSRGPRCGKDAALQGGEGSLGFSGPVAVIRALSVPAALGRSGSVQKLPRLSHVFQRAGETDGQGSAGLGKRSARGETCGTSSRFR